VIAVRNGIEVACADGSVLLIHEVQPESRAPMGAADFARGARVGPGQTFERLRVD
jgi:methionyl-tRNA formyltransferase